MKDYTNEGGYGIFIYHRKEINEPLCTYTKSKKRAIELAKELEVSCKIANSDRSKNEIENGLNASDDFGYIEVWERDKDGLYGNSGEPILHINL